MVMIMSSFICSVNHYKRTRQECVDVCTCNKYKLHHIGLSYDSSKNEIIRKIDKAIYELIRTNVASFQFQYNVKDVNLDKYIDMLNQKPEEHLSEPSESSLLGLKNALKCIDYQIEIDYNKEFLQGMINMINDIIVERAEDEFYSNEEFNKWEYDD